MKRKIILGIILTLPLLFLTIVTANTSMFTQSPNHKTKHTNNITLTGAACSVFIQLPSNSSSPAPPGGTPNHPTILKISAEHFDKGSAEGAFDGFALSMWTPVKNKFEGIALITDSANHADLLRTVYNHTYLWYPIAPPAYPIVTNLFPNVIQVEPKDLKVWTESNGHDRSSFSESNGHDSSSFSVDTLYVNLTKAVKITLPYYNATGVNSNQTFTLPPLSLMFKVTSSEFDDPSNFVANFYPGASNYTFTRSGSSQFAAVRINISDWLGGGTSSGYLEMTGTIRVHFVDTYIPPA